MLAVELDAAISGAFALGGVLLAGLVSWLTASETNRQARALAKENREAARDERRAALLRAGVERLAVVWAEVVRADSVRTHTRDMDDEELRARERMVTALTDLGAAFNALLVLPISPDMEQAILATDGAVTAFRAAEFDPGGRAVARQEVGNHILDLIRRAREDGTV